MPCGAPLPWGPPPCAPVRALAQHAPWRPFFKAQLLRQPLVAPPPVLALWVTAARGGGGTLLGACFGCALLDCWARPLIRLRPLIRRAAALRVGAVRWRSRGPGLLTPVAVGRVVQPACSSCCACGSFVVVPCACSAGHCWDYASLPPSGGLDCCTAVQFDAICWTAARRALCICLCCVAPAASEQTDP